MGTTLTFLPSSARIATTFTVSAPILTPTQDIAAFLLQKVLKSVTGRLPRWRLLGPQRWSADFRKTPGLILYLHPIA